MKIQVNYSTPSRLKLISTVSPYLCAVLVLVAGINLTLAAPPHWFVSPDGQSVQHRSCDDGNLGPDLALRNKFVGGSDILFTYGCHGPSLKSGGLELLNPGNARLGIASICHGGQRAAAGISVAQQMAEGFRDAGLELCQKYRVPVICFQDEVTNQADLNNTIFFTQDIGKKMIPLSDTKVMAYVPTRNGEIKIVQVKRPERLWPSLKIFNGWINEQDDTAKFIVFRPPRLEHSPSSSASCQPRLSFNPALRLGRTFAHGALGASTSFRADPTFIFDLVGNTLYGHGAPESVSIAGGLAAGGASFSYAAYLSSGAAGAMSFSQWLAVAAPAAAPAAAALGGASVAGVGVCRAIQQSPSSNYVPADYTPSGNYWIDCLKSYGANFSDIWLGTAGFY
jgi:hypothetical protein